MCSYILATPFATDDAATWTTAWSDFWFLHKGALELQGKVGREVNKDIRTRLRKEARCQS